MADIPPCKTIYVQNLYEKIRSVDQMKKCLYAIFSQFGKILDVVVMRSIRLRGQAWIVFEEIGSATAALRAMQGFPFFEKPMRLSYAKTKSDATAKVDGTLKEHLKDRKKGDSAAAREAHMERAKAKKAGVAVAGSVPQAAPVSGEQLPPNKILFVQNLPEASTAQMLSMLFQQFPGYVEVRLVDGRPGIAFVEYGNDMQATVALQGLQAFKITPQNSMAISYAKQRSSERQSHRISATIDSSSSSDDESPVDIDALARQLSSEAERLRRSESGREASSSSPRPESYAFSDPIFGPEAQKRHADFLSGIEGGFSASEFEILQQLGRLSWVTESAKDSPLQVTAASSEQVQAIIAFGARYYSGGPFQDPVKVLLKEFLPAAKPVGYNELEVSTTLSGLPDMKWQAAVATLSADPPVVPILGYFFAGQSETGLMLSQDEEQERNRREPSKEALWLVYKWENLQPINFYPAAEQPKARVALPFWSGITTENPLRARCFMLRSTLRAVAYCHEKGIAHGSLGSGSFLVNTFDDRRADSLLIKITNFGFAQKWSNQPSEQEAVPKWQLDDLQATALVLLETIFSALAEGGPSPNTCAEPLKRLVVEVFKSDLDQFRQYVSQEADLVAPAVLLDQFGSSGWALISALINGNRTARDLYNTNAFVNTSEY